MILVGVPAGEENIAPALVDLMRSCLALEIRREVTYFIESDSDLSLECLLKAGQTHSAFPGCFFQGDVIHQMFIDVIAGPPYWICRFIHPAAVMSCSNHFASCT
jgi:hypothetical protein